MKLLLLFYDDQINLFQVLVCSWNLLLLFYDDQINLLQVLVCSWTFTLILWWSDKPVSTCFYSYFMNQILVSSSNFYSFILWWSDKPVSTTNVFMKALHLFYDDQINRVSSNSVFMKFLHLFYDDQINLFQVLVCSWSFYSYFMMIR